MKRCSKCKSNKKITEFNKYSRSKDGLKYSCRSCEKVYRELNIEKIRSKDRENYRLNREEILEKSKLYYNDNKERIKDRQREYYYDNRQKMLDYQNNYQDNNKEKRNLYLKNRRDNDPLFKLSVNIRNSINNSFYNKNYIKESKTTEILGCSFEFFMEYLESKFEDWMSWDNRGLYNGQFKHGWDIDHIIPISSSINEKDLLELNHYTNLQPLCSKVNREIKGDKKISPPF
jgi:hypothetical protein